MVPRVLRTVAVTVFAVIVCLLFAYVLFEYVRTDIEKDARSRFDRMAADAKHIIERRLYSYVSVTYGLRALLAARNELTRSEFRDYVNSLNLKQN